MLARYITFRKILSLLLLLVFCIFARSEAVYAEDPGGITVAPVSITLELPKGAREQNGAVSVRNNSKVAVRFDASVRGVQQTSSGSLVLADTPDPVIATALSVTPQDFTLSPGQSINIKLRLTESNDLGPGGHYATLLVREVSANAKQVVIAQAVSVMVFITKQDGAVRDMKVSDIESDATLVSLPKSVTVSFGNTGNTGLIPRAMVRSFSPSGKLLASGVLNEGSSMILPGREIRLRSYLMSSDLAWMPGKYTVEVTYRYDGSDQQKVVTVSRWIMPPLSLAFIFAVLLTVAILARLIWWIWPAIRLRVKGKPKLDIHHPETKQRKTMDIIVRRKP